MGLEDPPEACWNPVEVPLPELVVVPLVFWMEPGGEKALPPSSSAVATALGDPAFLAAPAESDGFTCHMGGGVAGPESLHRKPLPPWQPVRAIPEPRAKPQRPAFSHDLRFERIMHPLITRQKSRVPAGQKRFVGAP